MPLGDQSWREYALVVYQDKSGSTFSEHCKSLKKLSMLMSAIVSKLSFLT